MDPTPSDYQLCLSKASDKAVGKLTAKTVCVNRVSQFFAKKEKGFYERGTFTSKWQRFVNQNVVYLTEIV